MRVRVYFEGEWTKTQILSSEVKYVRVEENKRGERKLTPKLLPKFALKPDPAKGSNAAEPPPKGSFLAIELVVPKAPLLLLLLLLIVGGKAASNPAFDP